MDTQVRDERTVARFSRGFQVVKAISGMWESNRQLPPGSNAIIAERIDAICAEFDLSIAEWHYWCDQVIASR